MTADCHARRVRPFEKVRGSQGGLRQGLRPRFPLGSVGKPPSLYPSPCRLPRRSSWDGLSEALRPPEPLAALAPGRPGARMVCAALRAVKGGLRPSHVTGLRPALDCPGQRSPRENARCFVPGELVPPGRGARGGSGSGVKGRRSRCRGTARRAALDAGGHPGRHHRSGSRACPGAYRLTVPHTARNPRTIATRDRAPG